MAEGGNEGGGDSRYVRDIQSLLRFCTEVTAAEDHTQPSAFTELTAERRQFLEHVLEGLTTNVARKLVEALQVLCSDAITMPGEDVSGQLEALEVMNDYVDDIDYANDVHKVGGFPALVRCLDSPHESIRSAAARVIGELCQNNPYCQEHMMEYDIVTLLTSLVNCDGDNEVRVAALFALSCVVRGNEVAMKKFLENDGFSCLMKAMQSGVDQLVNKSIFMLTSLVRENDTFKEELISMGYIEQLITLLSYDSTTNFTREHCTSLLVILSSTNPAALAECQRPNFGLVSVLHTRLDVIKSQDEFQEEEQYILELLKLIEGSEEDDGTCR